MRRPCGPGSMTEYADSSSNTLRALLRDGQHDDAAKLAAGLIGDTVDMPVSKVTFTLDEYSLNSVSGLVNLSDGSERFFKFHQEEGEEEHVAEYYRAHLLEQAGLPVEVPLAISTAPGRQMALYRVRNEPRMADICADLERHHEGAATLPDELLQARHTLDQRIGAVMTKTLTRSCLNDSRAPSPAIHQLFHHRLVDAQGAFPGGRYCDWYTSDPVWPHVADCTWRINGIHYSTTLRELFARAHRLLDPTGLADEPVVTAHGDDHHGNIWCIPVDGQQPELRLFDPAFAGDNIPALLAPVKATFHNALAHPMWLYQPVDADTRFRIEARAVGQTVEVETNATPSRMRQQILDSMADMVWKPLLAELRRRNQLRSDWRSVVRAAMFCCPTLVTNLLARARPECVRLLGLALSVMVGCEPDEATDPVAAFLDGVEQTYETT